ncbi:MAG: DinB family protein, partial [bacterium]
ATLRCLLDDLSDQWLHADEGPETFSPFDVVGHLIHGEKTDWIPRAHIILQHGESRPFAPFDRFAQQESSRGKSLAELLDEFTALRRANLETLHGLEMQEADLERTGIHPELGRVTLRELLATWVVHDLGHLAQMIRAMSGLYRDEVGPWSGHLPILSVRP